MIAPGNLSFFDEAWMRIGGKGALGNTILAVTGIQYEDFEDVKSVRVARRM